MPRNHNETTRFGADPLLDQELATKKYVDDNAGGTAVFYGASGEPLNVTQTTAWFLPFLAESSNKVTTETVAQTQIFEDLLLTAVSVAMLVNTKATDSAVFLREDAVDVAATEMTITASTTGTFSVTGLTTTLQQSGTLYNWKVIGTASGSLRAVQILSRLNIP